jgi:RNA polymerase sigma-70 factor (ECF subfamily)
MAAGQKRRSRPRGTEAPAAHATDREPAAAAVDRLLLRVARGDAQAFEGLCDQVSGAVYGLVHRIVGDQSGAEWVAAEVLVEVWRSASRFHPAEGSGIDWIMTMARRRAINQARTAGNGFLAGLAPAETAGRMAAKRAEGSLLAHRGVTSLPGPQREAVLLASCGYTWRQVADLVGVPAGTVAEWLREGLLGLSSGPE